MKMTHLLNKAVLVIGLIALAGFAEPLAASDNNPSDANPSPSATAAAHEAAKGDPLLEALLTELDRSTATLKMDQVQRPYYLEYRVHDVEEYNAEAAFGGLR